MTWLDADEVQQSSARSRLSTFLMLAEWNSIRASTYAASFGVWAKPLGWIIGSRKEDAEQDRAAPLSSSLLRASPDRLSSRLHAKARWAWLDERWRILWRGKRSLGVFNLHGGCDVIVAIIQCLWPPKTKNGDSTQLGENLDWLAHALVLQPERETSPLKTLDGYGSIVLSPASVVALLLPFLHVDPAGLCGDYYRREGENMINSSARLSSRWKERKSEKFFVSRARFMRPGNDFLFCFHKEWEIKTWAAQIMNFWAKRTSLLLEMMISSCDD